jgi:membrane protein required for colicin V production
MNWLDVTIIIICVAGIIQGLIKGFVRQAFSLLGLIFAIILAFRYHDILARYLGQWIEHPVALMIFSFILILVVILLLFKLIGLAARAAVSAISIGWLDRTAGGFFGLVKAIIIVAVLFGLFVLCTNKPTKAMTESALAPSVMEVSYVIARFLPPELRGTYDRNEEEIRKQLTSDLVPRVREVKMLEPVIMEESAQEPTPTETTSEKESVPPGEAHPPEKESSS